MSRKKAGGGESPVGPVEKDYAFLTALRIRDFKRIEAFEATWSPEGQVIQIAGHNGAGKSSVAEAIFATLNGAAALKPRHLGGLGITEPVRRGAASSDTVMTIGEFNVEKVFHASSGTSELKVTRADGSPVPRAQAMLTELVGPLAMDLMSFAEAPPKEALAELMDLFKPTVLVPAPHSTGGTLLLPLSFEEAVAQRERLFADRADHARDVKAMTARLEALAAPDPDLPTEPVSLADLSDTLRAALDTVQAVTLQQRVVEERERHRESMSDRVLRLQEEIARLAEQLEASKEEESDAADDVVAAKGALIRLQAAAVDPAPLSAQLAEAEHLNREITDAHEYNTLKRLITEAQRRVGTADFGISEIDAAKRRALEQLDLPVAGMAVDEEMGITFKGVPLQQASASERLKIGVALHLIREPKCRLVWLEGGAYLDRASRDELARLAKEHQLQVLLELVDDFDEKAIVIADGRQAPADKKEA